MADIKISELGAALTVGDSDVLPMTASGVTSKVSTSLLKDYVIGTTDISAIGDGTVTGAIDAINTDMPDGLDDLDDVSITTPADGEAPVYDSVSQKFKNTAIVTQDEFGDVIAPIEVSPSAHAYAVGKQLIYNDTLYKVIAPIAVNDALVVDTNIEVSPKTVIEQVEDNASEISNVDSELHDIWKNEGAYNRCPVLNTTQVINGVTWTVNSDGTVTANCSSNSHAKSIFWLWVNNSLTTSYPYTVRVCGAPSGASANTYHIGGAGIGEAYTEKDILANTAFNVALIVAENAVVDNIVFKPMITTDLNATYADYVPYAMTNRELTLKELYNSDNIRVYRQGNIIVAQFNGTAPKNIADLNFANIGAKPKTFASTFQCRCDGKPTTIEIKADGTVESVGYYASYGSSYTNLKTNTTTLVNGTISYVAD